MKTTGTVVRVVDLDASTVSAMFTLMDRYFDEFDRQRFESDLFEKDDVVLIHAGDELVGFSTIQLKEERVHGRRIRTIFSGDTIVDGRYWDTHDLHRGFVSRAVRAMLDDETPLYWFLICGGYRTYRYLPIFFHEFWPRFDRPTPADAQAIMDSLASTRYGSSYRNGVIVEGNGFLRAQVSPISERHLRNPHVSFFEQANPGHRQGHELVCLAEFSQGNMTRALAKLQEALTSS